MYKVKIIGAGSIGNHLAYACRTKGWEVIICDIDAEALHRTREEIYPSRYGGWDKEIVLAQLNEVPDENFDLVIIGTPPDTHLDIALKTLNSNPPRLLLIEKPLCTPSLEKAEELAALANSTKTDVWVGYNHTLTANTLRAAEVLKQGSIGRTLSISARFREYWGGIFAAHPWIDGPHETYLGFSDRGGGASGEHSHAINIWQHFAHETGMGRITEVSALLDIVDDGGVNYDRNCLLHVRTENGLMGDIAQDVITEPAQKYLRIQGTDGFLEWYVNLDNNHDAVRYLDSDKQTKEELILKTRPDDFIGEIDLAERVLAGEQSFDCPISLQRGLDTMLVIAAAHVSHIKRRAVQIDYEKGCSLEAIN